MEGLSNSITSMSALAVFSSLYKENKDIYSVIGEFAKLSIRKHNCGSELPISSLKSFIYDDHGFTIPEAVITTSVKRIAGIVMERRCLKILEEFYTNFSMGTAEGILQEEKQNREILEALKKFICRKRECSFSEIDQSAVEADFCACILDDSKKTEYSKDIYLFLLSIKEDKEQLEQINQIRDGLLIYVGLSYQTSANQVDTLSNELTIFLETEMLFNCAGYNGTVFKELFDEFYSLVEEINNEYRKTKQKDIIKLRYFEETQIETDSYFVSAEDIIRNNKLIDKNKSAMCYIRDHCTECYDVQVMKAKFYTDLKTKGILLEDKVDYYIDSNKQYNLDRTLFENSAFYAEYKEDERFSSCFELLNKVSIRRGNRPVATFNSIGYIILSGKGLTSKLASVYRAESGVPLATDLFFMTNRFWCMLHKSLAVDGGLKSFDVITRAKIALSSMFKKSLSQSFEEVKKQHASGKIDKSYTEASIANLQLYRTNPEDLDVAENVAHLESLTASSIEDYLAEALNKKQEKENLIAQQAQQISYLGGQIALLKEEKEQSDRRAEIEHKLLIEAMLKVAQKSEDEVYEAQKKQWETNKNIYVENQYDIRKNECIKKSCLNIFIWIAMIAVPAGTAFINGKLGIIVPIFSAVMDLIILFYSIFVSKEAIKSTFGFWKKSARAKEKEVLAINYTTKHPQPIRRICTESDLNL